MKKLIVTILFISIFSSGCGQNITSVTEEENVTEYNPKHPIEIEEQKCMKKADYTTAGMTMCTYNAMDRWFEEIDKYLKLLKKVTTEEEYANILKAQENWKKYQESEFVAISILMKKDGTIYQNILAGEECDIVKQRAMDLKGLYKELSSD